MNKLEANTTYHIEVPTRDAEGNAVNPDSVLSAQLFVGTTDVSTAMTLNTTPNNVAVGCPVFSFATPADITAYAGKRMFIYVRYVIGTITANASQTVGLFDSVQQADIVKWKGSVPDDLATGKVQTEASNMRGTDNALPAANVPTNFQALSITATTGKVAVDNVDECKADVSSLATQNSVDNLTSIATAILEDTSTTIPEQITPIGVVIGRLDDTLEDNVGVYRFTAAALAQAPSGGDTSDWTTAEKAQIRDALGVDGSKTTAADGQIQTIVTNIGALATTSQLTEVQKYIEGDVVINTSATPYQIIVREKGTVNTLTIKNLKDENGSDVASLSAFWAEQVETSS